MVYDLGKIIPRVKGNYSSSQQYEMLDIVYYQGSSYIAKSASKFSNKVPTNTTYWQILAAKGEMTTQLTPEQMLEIVTAVMNQGVVVDDGYAAFKSDTQQALNSLPEPNNGTLTIKRNNTTVGTFTANQSGNTDINISVPTQLSQMTDYSTFTNGILRKQEVNKSSDEDVVIEKIEPGVVYTFETDIKSLTIEALSTIEETGGYLPAHIYFTPLMDFKPSIPSCYFHDCAGVTGSEYIFIAGKHYELEINGDYVIARIYETVDMSA